MKEAAKKKLFFGLVFIILVMESWGFNLYPQAGAEYYFGANRFKSLKPWIGLRISLSPYASGLLKYTYHDLGFNYFNGEGIEIRREADLSQFIGAIYYARKRVESYAALSYFRGTEGYTAKNLDFGAGWKIASKLGFKAGVYLLDESSILWYPEEPLRRIKVAALRGGIDIDISRRFKINPQIYFYRTSEDVSATTLALSLVIIPHEPLYVVITFWNYRESASYRFSGNYFSIGLNFYY